MKKYLLKLSRLIYFQRVWYAVAGHKHYTGPQSNLHTIRKSGKDDADLSIEKERFHDA